ncbi:unnamed protein product [Paramecium octaurelia]|uniref:Uncharacterized protein n=1 Tax=Paramecium octaurelia TaxID=43137 RepID=A0A8S1SUR3_PAROT|nr:unnamed protein product [Paramecium octaurelia]CAD8142318.1 unnamed protein product [Paramecium octaurelia]
MKQQYRSQTPVLGSSLFDFNIPQMTITGQYKIRNACVLKKLCPEKKRHYNNPIKLANPRKNLKYLFINIDVNDPKLYDSDSDYQYRSMPKQKVLKQNIQRKSMSIKHTNLEMSISNLELIQRPFCKHLRSKSLKFT